MNVYKDSNFGSFLARGTSKQGSPLGDFVLEAVQLNPDGSGWLIAQINGGWLVEGDTLETDLRGQFGKITVQTRFSITVQNYYKTQLIGFGGISASEFADAVARHRKRVAQE